MNAYTKILSTARLRKSEVSGRTIITESESDRGRVLFCPAFRRLQQKAQVFSMEPNAAVRSRLTHSLEVAQLGRFIADEVSTRLVERNMLTAEERVALGNFVETACLLHDIGNPPFGHFGEAAIQKWFTDRGGACLKNAVTLSNGELGSGDPRLIGAIADFKEFDGNPQGLRVVSRLQWNTDEFGLNLTKTTIASFLKYIRKAGEPQSGIFTKKAGFFMTEEALIHSVWAEFEYAAPQRFPLAYMMEAADDLAYCISDLEDSIEKGLVHEPSALQEIHQTFLANSTSMTKVHGEIDNALTAVKAGKRPDGKEFTYTDFRTSLNRIIVGYAANRYVDSHDAILSGTLDSLLPPTDAPGAVLDALKSYCRVHVYRHESIQRTELAGYTAIWGLLEKFEPLLMASRDRFIRALNYEVKDAQGKSILIESKLLSLFPNKYVKAYKHAEAGFPKDEDGQFFEWNARAHLVIDFISGMTDDFAMTTYRTLAGMRL
jgi:dGTPase